MKLTNKQLLIAGFILAVVGYATGRYIQPAEVRIQTKEVEAIKKDVITIIKERKDKDGTVTKETVITDKTTIDRERESSKTVINLKPQWRIQGIVGVVDFKMDNPTYGVGVERRIIGPIGAGAYYKTQGNEVGLTISIEL